MIGFILILLTIMNTILRVIRYGGLSVGFIHFLVGAVSIMWLG